MRSKRRGFTLVELLIVVTIIGILISLILKAALSGIARAEHAATVALIAKLEAALTDRIDALTNYRADPTATHNLLGAVFNPAAAGPLPSVQRGQVIANYDYMRAELPDVFVVDTSDPNYKLNFAAEKFPLAGSPLFGNERDYWLPLGSADPASGIPNTGTRGASYAAAAAFYKQLGFGQKGLDGSDNDGDGMVDEWDEGMSGLPADQPAAIIAKLQNHKHKTARAEALYAIMIEGTGPLGSLFNKDDFNKNEIADTDGDGLLEFVDAWGEPLQWYRWPLMYRSDNQKGFPDLAKITQDTAAGNPIGPYGNVYEQRENDPLDPNATLVAPSWWGPYNSSYPWTGGAPATFGAMFHTLVDPLAATSNVASNVTYWDRSTVPGNGMFLGAFKRRAYYSRFLVLSGGPDKKPGVAMLGVDYRSAYGGGVGLDERGKLPLPNGTYIDHTNVTGSTSNHDGSGTPVAINVANVIRIENQGGKIDPNRDANGCPNGYDASGAPTSFTAFGRNDTNTLLEEYAQDDITSANLHASGGAMPSSQ